MIDQFLPNREDP
jgi:hypothetical protein